MDNMTNKRSVIFTLDAILAVIVGGFIITASYFLVSHSKTEFSTQSLSRISLDALAVLEKDGTFSTAVAAKNPSGLSSFLNSLPSNICGNLSIFDSSSLLIVSSQNSNCSLNQTIISRRVFVSSNFSTYYAEMKVAFD